MDDLHQLEVIIVLFVVVLALTTDCPLDEALDVYATLAEGVERSAAAA